MANERYEVVAVTSITPRTALGVEGFYDTREAAVKAVLVWLEASTPTRLYDVTYSQPLHGTRDGQVAEIRVRRWTPPDFIVRKVDST